MAFKKLIMGHASRKKPDGIRVSLSGKNNENVNIFISTKILIENNWPIEGRAFIYVDDEHEDVWMIEKCEDVKTKNNGSVKIAPVTHSTSKIQFRMKVNEKIDGKVKATKYEIKDECFIIYNDWRPEG